MARFNRKIAVANKIPNLAGGPALKMSPRLELASLLLTSFVQDQFYRNASDTVERVKELILAGNDGFVKFGAKAAIYARRKFGMRSITHVLAGEIAQKVKGARWTRPFYRQVIFRPDDAVEIAAYYLTNYGKPLPHSLRAGIAAKILEFDGYQLSKYRCEGKEISLVDLVNLCHPKPTTPESTERMRALMRGELKSKETWESKLTTAGQKAESKQDKEERKKEAWADLLKRGKLGYFAALRNINNIFLQAPECLPDLCALLADPEKVKKSMVMPFRFMTALDNMTTLRGCPRDVFVALEKAMDVSCTLCPKLPGKTLIALDESGSMSGTPFKIGAMFAAIIYKAMDSDLMTFSCTWGGGKAAKYRRLTPANSVLGIAGYLMQSFWGGGTDLNAVFQTASMAYDRIVILSDMQNWVQGEVANSALSRYKAREKCDPVIFNFDLAGHGSLQFPERNVYFLAGYSDKVFEVMGLLEKDREALVHEIEKVEL